MLKYLRLLLLPFSAVFGLAVWLRNRCYDLGIIKATAFDLPVIVVGNLAVGGTGKSPMTEYLIRLLADRYKVAVLSRGYGRKTKGFRSVEIGMGVAEVGDEPLQFKRKFPYITVAVCEDRVVGVNKLSANHDVILLDDAYQHRRLAPGLSVLLFSFPSLRWPRILLPAGDFRDFFVERKRADLMVVTKSPDNLAEEERRQLTGILETSARKPILFSSICYGDLMPVYGDEGMFPQGPEITPSTTILLITGIANTSQIVAYLSRKTSLLLQQKYGDHHDFTLAEARGVGRRFDTMTGVGKLIVTTEKDAQRLQRQDIRQVLSHYPIYYLPIRSVFNEPDTEVFDQAILTYCASFKQ